ncbi:MAG: sigma-70 family RNA polymerase sigma factor [Planctomycetes bacterium]|nr:sigma-70 family RNA polymerase sigma factor [Planctomycetota bacterium]
MGAPYDETEIGGAQREFLPTLWTVVLRAKDASAPDRREALERLIQVYWKPLYFYIRKSGHDVEKAKDIIQAFFAEFLEKDFLKYVERDRGKFRTFLVTALKHYVADLHDRAQAQKRGGGKVVLSFNFAQAETEIRREPSTEETPDRIFQRQWALGLFKRALQTLRREFSDNGRLDEFDALKAYFTAGPEHAPSYADTTKASGISESDVRTKINRARRRYREIILEEIRAYTETDDDAREELRELFSALA